MNPKSVLTQYSGLNGSIYILFVARIINCIGNFVFPFLTLFLTTSLGMSTETAGFFLMLTSLAAVPGTLLGGMLADRMGRKSIIVSSMVLSAICILTCAFLGKSLIVPWLIVASVFFSSMMHPATSAMIADLTKGERRNDAYALHYLGINIGTAIGPLVAGFLFYNFQKLMFIGDALTTLLAALAILAGIKESIPQKRRQDSEDRDEQPECNETDSDERAEKGSTMVLLLKRPYLFAFSLISVLISFAYSQHTFILPLYTDKLFGIDGPKAYGVLMSVNCIEVVLVTTLINAAVRKYKPVFNTAMSAVAMAIGFGMLCFTGLYSMLLLSTVIWTVGEILITTNSQVYIAAHSPITHRGRFNAVITFISRSGNSFGPAIMGLVLAGSGIRSAWAVTALIAASGAVLMYALLLVENISLKSSRKSVKNISA